MGGYVYNLLLYIGVSTSCKLGKYKEVIISSTPNVVAVRMRLARLTNTGEFTTQ